MVIRAKPGGGGRMMNFESLCKDSPSKEHAYNYNYNNKDDMGYYLECVHCKAVHFFECDTEDELDQLFGIYDDDDDNGYDDDDDA